MAERTRVLAVALDAAEWSFLERLMDAGELPVLDRLRREGAWRPVRARADIGSGAVWPTFATGAAPAAHGRFSGWAWNPAAMRVEPMSVGELEPFWSSAACADVEIGVLDVPFAPHAGLERGFEVTDWGPHDNLGIPPRVSPAAAERAVTTRHPFRKQRRNLAAPEDPAGLERLVDDCLSGARLRGDVLDSLIRSTTPDVAVGVFGEVHHCAHELWHTAEPEHPLFASATGLPACRDHPLVELHREIDRQLGRLVATVGDDAALVVFSLHGMGPVRGRAVLLQPLLEQLGFAHRAPAAQRSRTGAALALVKARAPRSVKRLYDRLAPQSVKFRVAQPNMLPPLDWTRTRAFSLPSDQHGWVRVSLQGRERDGLVRPGEYEPVVSEVEAALTGLRTEAGEPVVREVVRPGAEQGGPPALLPDLVVHWTDAVFEPGAQVSGIDAGELTDSPRVTGQHRPAGFVLAKGVPAELTDPVDAADLPALILAAARAG